MLGNGFSLTRRDGLPRFAARFADAGVAAVTVDFRHLGDSGGEPRQLIDYQRQRADLAAAVDFARTLDGIDADRVAVWGYSLAGGHAVHVAAHDDRLAAAVSMFPMLDGLAAALEYGLRNNARYLAAVVRATVGRRPIRMPVTGPPGSPAIVPRQSIARAADRAPRGELRRYSIGHFDGFRDAFEDVVADQLEFLERSLVPA